jgi:hypothetical protein
MHRTTPLVQRNTSSSFLLMGIFQKNMSTLSISSSVQPVRARRLLYQPEFPTETRIRESAVVQEARRLTPVSWHGFAPTATRHPPPFGTGSIAKQTARLRIQKFMPLFARGCHWSLEARELARRRVRIPMINRVLDIWTSQAVVSSVSHADC